MRTIYTDNAPKVVGPYSQAIESNHFIFCAGQIGTDPTTGELKDGIEEQTKQVMANISAVLKKADTDIDRIIKTTIFLTSMEDYAKVNDIYGSFFPNNKPARSTVAVATLPKNALVEIEVIAEK